ncbi:MAG: sigma-70 family RNA polymerase sigma factor [Flavobacteriales bacterium]|nr:sigma-70 family RNA polymerase sigma factor [Flavobacteriales bacterium]
MNDQKIVQYFKEGRRNKAFIRLYKAYPSVEKVILSKGGSKQEAEDIFQEALIVFYKKASQAEFELTSSISTYLYSVARYLWKDRLKWLNKERYKTDDTEIAVDDHEIIELIEKESKFLQVEEVLNSIGEKCLKILQLFYYQRLSMKAIARQVDLKSEKVAKNQKYKCLERARQRLVTLQNNPNT